MSKWMRLAAELEATKEGRANSANSANRSEIADLPAFGPPIGTNCTIGTPRLSLEIDRGLRSLIAKPCPPSVVGDGWDETVVDALGLARGGWAAQALALGWSPIDLFGVLDGTRESLAVWLRGRRMLLIDADCAVAHRDGEPPAYYLRRELPGAKLLWELRNGISVTNQEKRHD